MRKLRLSGVFCACMYLFGYASVADAALIHWGAQAGTSVADCPSFCTSFNFGPTLGGENVANSGISSVSEFRGDARASASLAGGLSTPVLKAESAAGPNTNGAFATAFGVQGYTYNGAGETLTLDIALDGLISDPEMDPFDTLVYLEVVLYAPDPFGFYLDRGTLDFEVGATPLSQPDSSEASVFLQLDHTNTTNDIGQISIEVATGDEFYIWAFLRAESESGLAATSADAFNTGSMNFVGNPDLIAASAAVVPLPAAVWLFGSGMLGLIGISRRKKAALQFRNTALGDRFLLGLNVVLCCKQSNISGARAAFRDYYVEKGQQRLAERVGYFAPKVGVEPAGLTVKEPGNRWASSSPSGRLAFHWKCMMAPLTIIDYIVVHELCHMREKNHSDAFWNEIDKVMPSFRERKEWLREKGAGLAL